MSGSVAPKSGVLAQPVLLFFAPDLFAAVPL